MATPMLVIIRIVCIVVPVGPAGLVRFTLLVTIEGRVLVVKMTEGMM